jgi:hypothetical protein
MRWSSRAAGWCVVSLALFGFCGPAQAECPAQKKVEEVIGKFEARDKRLLAVQPSGYPGLCEAHVQLNGKNHIFYTGPRGDFFIMGQLYDSSSGRNVTRETIESMILFSPEEMARLAAARPRTLPMREFHSEVVEVMPDGPLRLSAGQRGRWGLAPGSRIS